jgi:hypothetical protein
MPQARCASIACVVDSDIYVFGGIFARLTHSSVFKYDTEVNEWSTLAPIPHPCRYHSAQVLDGLVYIVGADDGSTTLRFDPETDIWSTLSHTSLSRMYGSSLILDGILYAAGEENSATSSVKRYDVAPWQATHGQP